MYSQQPFIRSGVGFLPQRAINSFPTGACEGFESREDIYYNQRDRDFLVNMAGCEYDPTRQEHSNIVDGDGIATKKWRTSEN
jgi:hypothetical protein